jgi:hypothetical protein
LDQKLFAGSGVGSGINHLGSGSGQPLSRKNLKQNFSDKIHYFSTKCTIKIILNKFFQKVSSKAQVTKQSPIDMNVLVILQIKCEFSTQLSCAGSETGSGSGVGAESGVGSETNHSRSTTLMQAQHIIGHFKEFFAALRTI